MQKTEPDRLIRFGGFELDPRTGELRSNGSRVKLQDQPLQVLLAVLEKPGDVVTREELRVKLWPANTFVDFDHGLNAAVKRLRDALGDTADNPRYIETLPRLGYRFIAAAVPDAMPPKKNHTSLKQEKSHTSPKQWSWLIGAAAVLLIVGALFAVDVGGVRGKLLSRSAAQQQIRSLAVLPLVNLSDNPEQEYFADGMTDELIGELSRLSALRVISRTSVMQYKGERKKSLSQIGRELNVDAVIEGTVLRSNNRVRIAAHMIYAPTDQSLITETYESDLADVLKLQREVAEAITQKVRLRLTPAEKARLQHAPCPSCPGPDLLASAPEVNPEAYQAFLDATSYLNWGLPQENEKARSYLQRAIRIDPGYADAYGALAATYVALGEQRLGSPQDVYPPAKQAIRKALELDEGNCSVHDTLALISWRYDWDWQAAERELRYAIESCPNYERSHFCYIFYLAPNGRIAEAQAEASKLRELDPLQSEPLHAEAIINYHARSYQALVEVSRSYTTAHPNIWVPHYWLGTGLEGLGQTSEAIPEYQRAVELSQNDSDPVASLAHAYAATGKRVAAEKTLRQWLRQSESSFVSPYMIATVYASLGDKDKAFEYLEKAYQIRSTDLPLFLRADFRLDTLRSDPRFQDLLRRMNFPK